MKVKVQIAGIVDSSCTVNFDEKFMEVIFQTRCVVGTLLGLHMLKFISTCISLLATRTSIQLR